MFWYLQSLHMDLVPIIIIPFICVHHFFVQKYMLWWPFIIFDTISTIVGCLGVHLQSHNVYKNGLQSILEAWLADMPWLQSGTWLCIRDHLLFPKLFRLCMHSWVRCVIQFVLSTCICNKYKVYLKHIRWKWRVYCISKVECE